MGRLIDRSLAVALVAFAASACAPGEAVITIDPSERHQVMRGWEVTIDDYRIKGLVSPERAAAAVVNDVGINRVRLEVRSGVENTDRNWTRHESGEITYEQWRPLRYANVNDNDDPNTINWSGFDFAELDHAVRTWVIPLREQMALRGERLFINVCYVAFTGQITTGTYLHDDPEEYAEFVLATYLHLQQEFGVTPDSWEVLLEPDNVAEWNPTLMGEAIVAASRRLEENGFEPAFVAPSTTDMGAAAPWLDGVADVDGAIDHVVEFSYHRYRNATRENARRIAETGARYGKPTAMLEWWFGNATPRVLYEDLTVADNAAWQGRVLGTVVDVEERPGEEPLLSVGNETRLNREYFRHVRMGAQRIGAASSAPGQARPAAFVNEDGGYVVVVIADRAMDLAITGAPPGAYAVSYELGNSDGGELPDPITADAQGLSVRMPGEGVIAVYSAPSNP